MIPDKARGLVALTGASGFLGPYLVRALCDAGWRVRALVRHHKVSSDAVEIVSGSLSESAAMERLLDGADVLVHAAGLIKAVRREDFYAVNVAGARALAIAAQRYNPALRAVLVSSLSARHPALSAYAHSKRQGEDAFVCLPNRVVVRPTAVYGPGDKETAVFFRAAAWPLFCIPRVPGGRVTMIHARDAAAAVAALCAPEVWNETAGACYELTDACTQGYPWRVLAAEILSLAGRRARIAEVPDVLIRLGALLNGWRGRLLGKAVMLTPGKARELLHADWSSSPASQPPAAVWRPSVALRDGLRETLFSLTAALTPETGSA